MNFGSFSKLDVAKFVVSGIVGMGTGKIVSSIIKSHVTPANLIDKVTIVAASWAISGIAAERTKGYTDEVIDRVVSSTDEYIAHYKLQMKLARVNSGASTLEKEGLTATNFRKNEEGKWEKVDEETKEPVSNNS